MAWCPRHRPVLPWSAHAALELSWPAQSPSLLLLASPSPVRSQEPWVDGRCIPCYSIASDSLAYGIEPRRSRPRRVDCATCTGSDPRVASPCTLVIPCRSASSLVPVLASFSFLTSYLHVGPQLSGCSSHLHT